MDANNEKPSGYFKEHGKIKPFFHTKGDNTDSNVLVDSRNSHQIIKDLISELISSNEQHIRDDQEIGKADLVTVDKLLSKISVVESEATIDAVGNSLRLLHQKVVAGDDDECDHEFAFFTLLSERSNILYERVGRQLVEWFPDDLTTVHADNNTFVVPQLIQQLTSLVSLPLTINTSWSSIYSSCRPLRIKSDDEVCWIKPLSSFHAEMEDLGKEIHQLLGVNTFPFEIIDNPRENEDFYGRGSDGDSIKLTKLLISPHVDSVPLFDFDKRLQTVDGSFSPQALTELRRDFGRIAVATLFWGSIDVTHNQNIAVDNGLYRLTRYDFQYTSDPTKARTGILNAIFAMKLTYSFLLKGEDEIKQGYSEGIKRLLQLIHSKEGKNEIRRLFKRRQFIEARYTDEPLSDDRIDEALGESADETKNWYWLADDEKRRYLPRRNKRDENTTVPIQIIH